MSEHRADTAKGHIIPSARVRAYLYGVMVAAGAVALVYGLVNAEQLGVWLALGGAVLGVSNAVAYANVRNP